MSAVEKFPVLLSEAEEESSAVPPCFSDEGINVRLHSKALLRTIEEPPANVSSHAVSTVSLHPPQ